MSEECLDDLVRQRPPVCHLKKEDLCKLIQKRYGDDLANIIGNRKGSKLTPGTIYPALKNLKNIKLIIMKQTGRKKFYYLTKKGKNELNINYKFFGNMFIGLRRKIKD